MQVDVLLRVRFAECDPQNVVFNARYADYVDLVSTEYMRFMCGGYDQLVASGFSTQVVSLKIDWQSSAKFDDVLRISMRCERIGNTSFTLTTQIVHYATQRPVATAESVYVTMDSQHSEKRSVPDDIRVKLREDRVYGPIDLAAVNVLEK